MKEETGSVPAPVCASPPRRHAHAVLGECPGPPPDPRPHTASCSPHQPSPGALSCLLWPLGVLPFLQFRLNSVAVSPLLHRPLFRELEADLWGAWSALLCWGVVAIAACSASVGVRTVPGGGPFPRDAAKLYSEVAGPVCSQESSPASHASQRPAAWPVFSTGHSCEPAGHMAASVP